MGEVEGTEDVPVLEDGKEVPVLVERGTMDWLCREDSICILAEGAPSWALLVPLIGCRELHIYVASPLPDFRLPVDLPVKILTLRTMASVISLVRNGVLSNALFLLQGKAHFVAHVTLEVLEARPNLRCIGVASGRRSSLESKLRKHHPGLNFGSFSHSSIGGVTKGGYVLVYNLLPVSSVKKELTRKVSRNLESVIKPDLRCSRMSSSPLDVHEVDAGCLEINIYHSPAQLTKLFRVPCVFKSSGWGLRKLQPEEIGSAMDLPPGILSSFAHSIRNGSFTLHDFLCLPPVKSLQFALSVCLGIGTDVSEPSHQPANTSVVHTPVFDSAWRLKLAERHTKAVKADDADVEIEIWNRAVLEPFGISYSASEHDLLFDFLRRSMSRQYKLNVLRSFVRYMLVTYGFLHGDELCTSPAFRADWEAGVEALNRVGKSTFWAWDGGSSLLFWRWPIEIRRECRDGCDIFVKGPLPRYTRKQRLPVDATERSLLMDKIDKVRSKKYITEGLVKSLTSFFAVPKGDSDIRVVYDLTACGLNEALWAPSFWMPTVDNVLDVATHKSWFSDIDAAEMFLNYKMDKRVQPYAGVDVSWAEKGKALRWERWSRMAMGLVSSPYATTRLFAWGMEVVKGNRMDQSNPFAWTEVKLNLPGTESYNPVLPRVFKFNAFEQEIASDVKTFMDDSRGVGATRELCQEATHRIETLMSYLGVQDATRKRRPNSQTPGEWTGSITLALEGVGLFVTVSQKKWDKAKGIIAELLGHFETAKSRPQMILKDLERKTGFLVHLAMAFPAMMPFLRGLYLTMNSWRKLRDGQGWKLTKRAFEAFMQEARRSGEHLNDDCVMEDSESPPPVFVRAVPRLFSQLKALEKMFESDEPGLRLVRGTDIMQAMYIFGDASGSGFGSSWNEDVQRVGYRFGVWGEDNSDKSSNFRELRNLVETLEALGREGKLNGKEIFIFTDNMVSESIAAAGSSTSELLYDLVVRLVACLGMRFRCSVQFIHVAGTRMIKQGSDGLSRGDLYEGVMSGKPMLYYIPLADSALDRAPRLLPWIQSWFAGFGSDLEVLDKEGWFERGHDIVGGTVNSDGVWLPRYQAGTFVWAPPPAAARIVAEELRQARQKRQQSAHVFVVPRLMWVEWRKHLFKSADLMFDLPVGSDVWPAEMHETLIFAVYFPYLSRYPWELRKSPLLVDVDRRVRLLLKEDISLAGNFLSQFCDLTRWMGSMPLRELRRVLQGKCTIEVPSE